MASSRRSVFTRSSGVTAAGIRRGTRDSDITMASRMIITLDPGRRRALRREARRLGISASELVRRSLDAQLGGAGGLAGKDAWLSLVGLGEGDGSAVARRHHAVLKQALGVGGRLR